MVAPKRRKHPRTKSRVARAVRPRKPRGSIGDAPAMRRLVALLHGASDAERNRLARYLARKEDEPTMTEELRNAIEQSGLTRYRISRDLGIDQAQLSRFMRGQRGLSLDALDRLCAYLNLSLSRRKKAR